MILFSIRAALAMSIYEFHIKPTAGCVELQMCMFLF